MNSYLQRYIRIQYSPEQQAVLMSDEEPTPEQQVAISNAAIDRLPSKLTTTDVIDLALEHGVGFRFVWRTAERVATQTARWGELGS